MEQHKHIWLLDLPTVRFSSDNLDINLLQNLFLWDACEATNANKFAACLNTQTLFNNFIKKETLSQYIDKNEIRAMLSSHRTCLLPEWWWAGGESESALRWNHWQSYKQDCLWYLSVWHIYRWVCDDFDVCNSKPMATLAFSFSEKPKKHTADTQHAMADWTFRVEVM